MLLKRFFTYFLLISSLLACEEEHAHAPNLPLEEAVLGNWMVVYQKNKQNGFYFKDEADGVVTAWGCYYVHHLSIRPDHTFVVNHTDSLIVADSISAQSGHWELKGNQMVFYCPGAAGPIQFKVNLSKSGSMSLENDLLLLRHQKKL